MALFRSQTRRHMKIAILIIKHQTKSMLGVIKYCLKKRMFCHLSSMCIINNTGPRNEPCGVPGVPWLNLGFSLALTSSEARALFLILS